MRLRTTVAAGSLALVMALAVSGCDSLGGTDDSGGAAKGTTGFAPGQPDEMGTVIASRDIQISESGSLFRVKVELYQLRRDKGFVNLNVRMTRTDPAGSPGRWQIASAFQGETVSLAFSGVTLVDRKNRKRHLVARAGDSDAKPGQVTYLASSGLASVFVTPGQSVDLYAMFGAPPDDVTAVDVVIPRVPVFENVPLG
ncbi:hypothetical protein OHA01_02520 [Micromonospora zamorensis]|uniref:hypothetical protein n=2 Tax=Micromonosporaceae TaxID=28056 RepID=UPI00114FD2EA|nr:hypothetical protein [Micromonospora sp. A202]TQJ23572.1 hypothetical protein FBZ33_3878 [Micromonospora sp. A202]WTE87614.1 hypothetical protein OHA01_02520 [Micromonospora zamorensis]